MKSIRTKVRKAIPAILLTATLAQSAQAGTAAPSEPSPADPLPTALAPVLDAGAHVTFIGMVDGLQGWLITRRRPDGSILAVPAYVTPGGRRLVLGRAHDSDGTDITAKQEDRLALRVRERDAGVTPSPTVDIGSPATLANAEQPQPPASTTDTSTTQRATQPGPQGPTEGAVISQSTAGPTITADDPTKTAESFAEAVRLSTANFRVGRAGAPIAYVVADAGCTACGATIGRLRSSAVAGKTELVVIVTSTPGSPDTGPTLLAQPKPALGWYAGGPIKPASAEKTTAARAWIAANDAFATRLGKDAIPFVAYINDKGHWTVERNAAHETTDAAGATTQETGQ